MFVGQGVYVGPSGVTVGVWVSVGVGESVGVSERVALGTRLGVAERVGVANTVARKKLTASTEVKARTSSRPIPPPIIHALQFVFLGTTIFKSRGTLIKITVMLS